MAFWMDLLFGNWTGILSMFTIFFATGLGLFFAWMFVKKSKPQP